MNRFSCMTPRLASHLRSLILPGLIFMMASMHGITQSLVNPPPVAPTDLITRVDPTQAARVIEALPTSPAAQPTAPRNVLIFADSVGFWHESIPIGAYAFEQLGQATGAWRGVVTQDPAAFSDATLTAFDGIVLINTTGDFLPKNAQRAALLRFVRGGGALIGVHAASDAHYDWAEYGRLIGGYFDGHPWTHNVEVGVEITEPDHPVVAGFEGQRFSIEEEIYQFKVPYSRDRLRVLLRLDTERSPMDLPGIKRTDGDFAISWIRNEGEGRVFYTSLGHNPHIFWHPGILKHYLAGAQWALGDLEADARPSAALE